ncbi:MAG: DUF1570 domain-containing protein [Planctomycetes bacterium]|nr:DUF1570 domain-containing protein [Planctomycetota bacterium]
MRYFGYVIIALLAILSGRVHAAPQDDTKPWADCKTKVSEEIAGYRYAEAVTLLEDFLRTGKNEKSQREANEYLEDLKGEQAVFQKLINSFKGDDARSVEFSLGKRKVTITKADAIGLEGKSEGGDYNKKWPDISTAFVFDLFPGDLEGLERFYLGVWCYNHYLSAEGDKTLIAWLEANPEEKPRLDRFLCRYKNISLPAGGFTECKGRLVLSEDKPHLEKGLIKYKGKWLTFEEVMKARGLIKFMDSWVTLAEKSKLEQEIKALEQVRKKFAPKGVIDKPGADSEPLAWAKARTKKTDHYLVKTNLSADALEDICFLMECLDYKAQQIFKLTLKTAPFNINYYRTKEEYVANGGPGDAGGCYGVDEFGPQIKGYYDPPDNVMVLMHEGTHRFVHLACGSYSAETPIWISEGLATYFECSKYDGAVLRTNLVNNARLGNIKQLISGKKAQRLEDFINIKQEEFELDQYAQAWSLVYFFINYNDGQYAKLFDTYFGSIKKKGLNAMADNKTHLKMFEEAFKVKCEVLEKQWVDYIMKLEPAPEPEEETPPEEKE